jgi:hypothetical protein
MAGRHRFSAPCSVDFSWSDTLQNGKQEMKNSWFKFINNDLAYLKDRFNVSLSDDDIEKLDFIPVATYSIDSISFSELKPNTSIEDVLALQKAKADCYVVKDKAFLFFMYAEHENGEWETTGLGAVFKNYADTLSFLYFNKDIRFFTVYVETINSKKGGRPYTVYREKDKLECLKFRGKTKPFLDELLDYKAYLKQMKESDK